MRFKKIYLQCKQGYLNLFLKTLKISLLQIQISVFKIKLFLIKVLITTCIFKISINVQLDVHAI